MVLSAVLARFVDEQSAPLFLLKGGVAMELRVGVRARASKDYDTAFRDELTRLGKVIGEASVLIDGLLGTGLAGLVVEDLDVARRQAVDPVDGAADPHDRAPVTGVDPELEPEFLVQRRAGARELAIPEVVEQGGRAPAIGLLGRRIGKAGGLPLGREELPEIMAASAVRVGLDRAREPVKQIVNFADEHGEL